MRGNPFLIPETYSVAAGTNNGGTLQKWYLEQLFSECLEKEKTAGLNAYEEMDSQPVQGENITSSKKEIEETIDTLNVAFEKLLDSIFEDTAMDVSSDISVLNTVLAQEGLTEDELTRMRKEAEKNRL